jgi:hypothetical protein
MQQRRADLVGLVRSVLPLPGCLAASQGYTPVGFIPEAKLHHTAFLRFVQG